MEKNNAFRIKTAMISFIVLLLLLCIRIWYIQILCHDELSSLAKSQYGMSIVGLDTRGAVLDRNFKPLTGGIKEYYYLVDKNLADSKLQNTMDSLGACQMAREDSPYLVYRTEAYNDEVNRVLKRDYKAYTFESSSRYADEQIACHLLGYINKDEQRGVSGLELMYQNKLAAEDSSLFLWADATGNIIRGVAPSVETSEGRDEMSGNMLVTTLDRRVQYICEKSLKQTDKDGAALVMDGETGEILAWASSPSFNPNDVASYLNDDSDCLVDKVCQGTYAPGSVFKIVTAAAALESGKATVETKFACEGEATVEGITVSCSTGGEEGHGTINMKTAMAQSCNCYFVQLGEKIGCEAILNMAVKMGFGKQCFDNFPGEAEGNVPESEEVGTWDTTNLSIGQGKLLVTPLQTAVVTSIIANGGIMTKPCLVLSDENRQKERIISNDTAIAIDEMLSEVMQTGTGSSNWDLEVRGKTGTAEAVSSGKNVNNCWFTGYFSVEGRTYVVTVLVENGISGASTAMPVFKDLCNFLADNF